MAKIKFIAIALAAMVATRSHALTGSWRGDLAVGQMKIGLVFNFSEDDAGATSCAIDSPSQGAKEIPTTVKLCEADSIDRKSVV